MTEFQLFLLEKLAWLIFWLTILGCIIWTVIKYKRGDFDG